jgi:hypothetical protein
MLFQRGGSVVDGDDVPVVFEVVGEAYDVRKVSARWRARSTAPGVLSCSGDRRTETYR